MSITIQHRFTGATIKVVEADSLRGADLRGAEKARRAPPVHS